MESKCYKVWEYQQWKNEVFVHETVRPELLGTVSRFSNELANGKVIFMDFTVPDEKIHTAKIMKI